MVGGAAPINSWSRMQGTYSGTQKQKIGAITVRRWTIYKYLSKFLFHLYSIHSDSETEFAQNKTFQSVLVENTVFVFTFNKGKRRTQLKINKLTANKESEKAYFTEEAINTWDKMLNQVDTLRGLESRGSNSRMIESSSFISGMARQAKQYLCSIYNLLR